MDLAGFCDKNIIVSDEALHCGGGRGVKPFFVRAKPCLPLWSFSLIRKTELWRTNKSPALRVVRIALALCKKPPMI